jgi:hypothetical protein
VSIDLTESVGRITRTIRDPHATCYFPLIAWTFDRCSYDRPAYVMGVISTEGI